MFNVLASLARLTALATDGFEGKTATTPGAEEEWIGGCIVQVLAPLTTPGKTKT